MRLFLDSSTIIFGIERMNSNSAVILDLVFAGRLESFVNYKVLEEVRYHFERTRGREFALDMIATLSSVCKVVLESDIHGALVEWRGKVKEKDLPHVATAKAFSLDALVGVDRHFEGFPEYITPNRLVKKLGLKPFIEEY